MRKGQAALEYLVTYGWAFIAILVVLGALAYFGFLTPDRYLPSRCDFGAQLECIDFILVDQVPDQIQIQFRNNFGDEVNITDIRPLECGADVTYTHTLTYQGGDPDQYRNISKGGVSGVYTFDYDPDPTLDCLIQGERQSVILNISFQRNKAGSPVHGVIGEIFSTTQ